MPPKKSATSTGRRGGRSASPGRAASSPRAAAAPPDRAAEALKRLGWVYSPDDGFLRSASDGQPYSRDAFQGDYEELASAISDVVVEMLECPPQNLQRMELPAHTEPGVSRQLFASAGALEHAGQLIVLIPGITCRAGVWSRSLCATDGLEVGSMQGYLRSAREQGMAQIVLDPNANSDPADGGMHTKHCVHAVQFALERARAAELFIVAHSYGGASLVDMLYVASPNLLAKIRGIAFTDSVHFVAPGCLQLVEGRASLSQAALDVLQVHGVMWQADDALVNTLMWRFNADRGCRIVSAGVAGHAETNASAKQSIFEHFRDAAERPRGGSLRAQRPSIVAEASRAKFAEQENAGKNKGYGAIGSMDYGVDATFWDCATGDVMRRQRIFGLSELMAVCREAYGDEGFAKLRVLDLGCGDGQSLWALHTEYGLPWSQLCGITAEDMRGVPVLDGEEPFDLRAKAGADAEDSYIVWNIEELEDCFALRGRTFDVIISWVTFCWLTDPVGALEFVHDRLLARGGLLMVGSMQMMTGAEPEEDVKLLLGLRACLVDIDSSKIEAFVDAAVGVYTWWVQRKSTAPDASGLRLGRFLRYRDAVEADSHKAVYDFDQAMLGHAASAYASEPVPSTRLRLNDEALDDTARLKYAEELKEFRPYAEFDLRSTLLSWIAEDPCEPGVVEDPTAQTAVVEMIRARFMEFDSNGDGSIHFAELASVLKRLDPSAWDDARVKSLFSAVDTKQDGRIDCDEFLNWAFFGYSASKQELRHFRKSLEMPMRAPAAGHVRPRQSRPSPAARRR